MQPAVPLTKQALLLIGPLGAPTPEALSRPPSPLVEVAGVATLVRAALTLRREGIDDVVVCAPEPEAEEAAETAIGARPDLRETVPVVPPEDALAVLPPADAPLTLMDAHLLAEPRLVRQLLRAPVAPDEALVAVASGEAAGTPLDIADGRLCGLVAPAAGPARRAVGLVVAGRRLVERFGVPGDATALALQAAAAGCTVRVCDVTAFLHQRVTDPEAQAVVTDALFERLRLPHDGVVARLVNRRLSLALTRHLFVPWRVAPADLTMASAGLVLAATLLFVVGAYVTSLLAALLVLFARVLDGADGEIARLTFQERSAGAWGETVAHGLADAAVLLGLGLGVSAHHDDAWVPVLLGWLAFGMTLFVQVVVLHFLASRMHRGEAHLFRWWFEYPRPPAVAAPAGPEAAERVWVTAERAPVRAPGRLVRFGKALAGRDTHGFVLLAATAVGLPEAAFALLGGVVATRFVFALYQSLFWRQYLRE